MKEMMMKAKGECQTEYQRQAWQRGYDMVLEHRGPKNPMQRWLEETLPEATGVPIHPLSKEMLHEEIENVPEDCHEAMVSGFFTAAMDRRG